MKNIIQLPDDTLSAVVVLQNERKQVICFSPTDGIQRHRIIALLFGCFVKCLQEVEEEQGVADCLREAFQRRSLEEMRDVLVQASVSTEEDGF